MALIRTLIHTHNEVLGIKAFSFLSRLSCYLGQEDRLSLIKWHLLLLGHQDLFPYCILWFVPIFFVTMWWLYSHLHLNMIDSECHTSRKKKAGSCWTVMLYHILILHGSIALQTCCCLLGYCEEVNVIMSVISADLPYCLVISCIVLYFFNIYALI